MHERDRATKHKPLGPFSPPTPSEVEDTQAEPMAVARDKQQTHGESFLATSAPMDPYDDDVARRYRQVPARDMIEPAREENRAMERPDGYGDPDERGWIAPRADEEESADEGGGSKPEEQPG